MEHLNISNDTKNDSGGVGLSSNSYPEVMTLRIGGRRVQTRPDTLIHGSGYFKRQLSGLWTWTPEADGSYFVDADPDLFAHLLRFMRRPEIFPLYYTKTHGYDYDLYNRLEVEAKYFEIDELYMWIKEKKYLEAVTTHTHSARIYTLNQLADRILSVHNEEENHVVPRIRRVYICPRGILVHRGDKDKCGHACFKAKGGREDEYDEEHYVEIVSIQKEAKFHGPACRID
jgi:hypothetical protein